jgi:hypothetical protein
LRARFGIQATRAYNLAHSVFSGPYKRAKACELPCERLRSQPEPPRPRVPDVYVESLRLFLDRYCQGRLPLPEDDLFLVGLFAKRIPPEVSDLERSEIVLSLACAIRELREASPSPWVH